MKLPYAFCRLPLRFDAHRLRQEVLALPAEAWRTHPTGYAGNSSVRLISSEGTENDEVAGPMLPTPQLAACPYIRQILAGFDVVWGRSRLMRLAGHAEVPEHCDINYHWFSRVRLHIPVVTTAKVRFHCGDDDVYMAPGEPWLFDNWRPHRVINGSDEDRIHIVADTTGTSAFWQLARQGQVDRFEQLQAAASVPFDAGIQAHPLTEKFNAATVMHPGEMEFLLQDLLGDLALVDNRRQLIEYSFLIRGLAMDWRQLWALHEDRSEGWARYIEVRDRVAVQARALGTSIIMRSNGMPATRILEARVLAHAISADQARGVDSAEYAERPRRRADGRTSAPKLLRPVFIVAAPRSGSTLLYETLAVTPQLWNLGGEAHWLIESIPQLKPGAAGVDSNQLTSEHANPDIDALIRSKISEQLQHPLGQRWQDGQSIRLLEKTPKNALRVPFLARLFPDALFVFLWRQPAANLASIIEAWASGRWITYPDLDDGQGPWSLLLPPGWRSLRGRPIAEIATFQWEVTNQIVIDNLMALPRKQWICMEYDSFLKHPAVSIERVANFAGLTFDAALSQRCAGRLPLSRHTFTLPSADKWKAHEATIKPLLHGLETTVHKLKKITELS